MTDICLITCITFSLKVFYSERGLFDILFRFIYLLDFISDGFYKGRYNISFCSVCSLCVSLVDKLPPQKPSTRKTKVGKEVKEAIQPEIKRAKFSIIVEEPSQQSLIVSWLLIKIWSIFILAPIQKVKHILTVIQLLIFYSLNLRIFLKTIIEGDCL